MSAIDAGHSGHACASGTGARVRIFVMISFRDGASKGVRPTIASYNITPTDHTSAGGPTSRASVACSGHM